MLERLFPFGKAPLLLLFCACTSGVWLLLNPAEQDQADLRLWVFAPTHMRAYQQALPQFEAQNPGKSIAIQHVQQSAVTYRLRAAFWSDLVVPDLVEVEISAAGSFFRGPPDEIGFADLTPYLQTSGLLDRIVATRLAPYTDRGRIYGLPHDVHPVMLAYRRDLFAAEGLDPAACNTWDELIALGRTITRLPENDHKAPRFLLELNDGHAGDFEVVLFQNDGGLFDAHGQLIMDGDVTVETLKWYLPLVAGPQRIGTSVGGTPTWVRALQDGYILMFICADWRSKVTEQYLPALSGKMALMPLPTFKPGGRRTSTRGGTMLGLTKNSRNSQLAWALAEYLYFDPRDQGQRFRDTNILPAVRELWQLPEFQEERPYWSGQRLGKLYADLADEVPPQYGHPYIELAKAKLAEVLSGCANYYRKFGAEGLDSEIRRRLKIAADEVREQMKRNPF